ncbi:MAG: SDR family oxidoreductase [Clostridia bacterium]|nr:SDR family oxidoreductase [Clostridia bacterium]
MAYDYKKQFSVEGKKCIVTGGAQGLSRGMAEGLLENGAEVVLMDLQAEKLQAVVDEYNKMGYKAYGVAGDLSKKPEIDRMFDEAMEKLGGTLDVMIPAAGIQRRYEPWEFPEDAWRLVIDVDLNHVWFMCQKAIQVMKDKENIGKIINVASMNAYFGGTTVPAYSAAKGAVAQLTKSIASDCADHSICCNAIAPGYMDTEMCANMTQQRKDECTARIPAARWGLPDDMKGPIIFLASSASDYLNGAVIPVDGGFLVKS